jgi:hypothetical protein
MTTQTAYDGLTDDNWHLVITARPVLISDGVAVSRGRP